ncbi:MAG: hypothetical protein QM343_09650, partial [Bacillota bacterium]|nr:hypothetical protein [Bacillota bacterium]
AYGRHISDSDNSMNEIITCNVTKDKSLILEMTMNMYGNNEANTADEVLKVIWKTITQGLT